MSGEVRVINLRVPERVWGALANIADQKQVKIADLRVAVVRDLLTDQSGYDETITNHNSVTDQVVRLNQNGLTVKEIAVQTGVAVDSVWKRMRDRGYLINPTKKVNE